MIVIGLTGGIASGKSTVSNTLAELGAQVINADNLGHDLLHPGTETWQEVVSIFGRDILLSDDTVDRHKLGEIVFHDPLALRQLNGIMHPRLYREVAAIINNLREHGAQVVVLEAALLVEAGWTSLVNEIWLTTVPEAIALQRLMTRDRMSEEKARARIHSQIPVADRIKGADIVIDTSVSPEQVKDRVTALWQELQKRNHINNTAPPSAPVSNRKGNISKETIRKILSSREYVPSPNNGILTPAAVLLPLFRKEDGDWYILFTKRTDTVATHRGQISFPGGVREPHDRTLEETALRETMEEIGIPAHDIEVLGRLDDQDTRSYQFVIAPFVGVIPYPHPLTINQHEIDFIIEVPLRHFLGTDALCNSLYVHEDAAYTTYYSSYEGHLIWGATATILKRFLDLIFPS